LVVKWWANVVENCILFSLCLYFFFFNKKKDWKAIAEQDATGVEIPIQPKVKSSTDFSNFDQDCISEETPAEKCSWNAEGF
jgi:hypothetical protein